MVDIIQAVGRVVRKAAGKQIGTIVIPVFIDESEDADLPTLHGLPSLNCLEFQSVGRRDGSSNRIGPPKPLPVAAGATSEPCYPAVILGEHTYISGKCCRPSSVLIDFA